MELRFVEGNFEHGKFKLQMGKEVEPDRIEWVDVPCVKEEAKVEHWCEHVQKALDYDKNKRRWYVGGGWGLWATDETMFCPICGAKKP